MFHIGYLNLASHTAMFDMCKANPSLSNTLSPVMAGSSRRIARGILKGWLDGGLLPLPFAHVLARWQKGLTALVCIKDTGSALLTPGSNPVTDMRQLSGKRVLFSCIGSMEYLLAHRLFKECGLELTLENHEEACTTALHAEPMAFDLIPEALRLNPGGEIGAAVVEEPALTTLLDTQTASQLMHCHQLWPEYTAAVLVMRCKGESQYQKRINRLAEELLASSAKASSGAPTFHLPCKADFLATGEYLDSQQLAPLIASLL